MNIAGRLPFLVRLVWAALGLLFLASGAEHLIGSGELRQHYDEVGFSASATPLVGGVQLIAAVGLLVPRFQPAAAAVVVLVMAVATASHFRRGPTIAVGVPIGVMVWAGVPLACWRRFRRPARMSG